MTSSNPYIKVIGQLNERKFAGLGGGVDLSSDNVEEGEIFTNDDLRRILVGLDLDVEALADLGIMGCANIMTAFYNAGVAFRDAGQAEAIALLLKSMTMDFFVAGVKYERDRGGS